jgi:hypothetical protein
MRSRKSAAPSKNCPRSRPPSRQPWKSRVLPPRRFPATCSRQPRAPSRFPPTSPMYSAAPARPVLGRAVEELSKHLDAVGHTIDALGDTDPRIRVIHTAKLDRKRLTKAMLELSQAAEKLSAIQQELAEAVAHRTGPTANQDQLETVTDGQQKT